MKKLMSCIAIGLMVVGIGCSAQQPPKLPVDPIVIAHICQVLQAQQVVLAEQAKKFTGSPEDAQKAEVAAALAGVALGTCAAVAASVPNAAVTQ